MRQRDPSFHKNHKFAQHSVIGSRPFAARAQRVESCSVRRRSRAHSEHGRHRLARAPADAPPLYAIRARATSTRRARASDGTSTRHRRASKLRHQSTRCHACESAVAALSDPSPELRQGRDVCFVQFAGGALDTEPSRRGACGPRDGLAEAKLAHRREAPLALARGRQDTLTRVAAARRSRALLAEVAQPPSRVFARCKPPRGRCVVHAASDKACHKPGRRRRRYAAAAPTLRRHLRRRLRERSRRAPCAPAPPMPPPRVAVGEEVAAGCCASSFLRLGPRRSPLGAAGAQSRRRGVTGRRRKPASRAPEEPRSSGGAPRAAADARRRLRMRAPMQAAACRRKSAQGHAGAVWEQPSSRRRSPAALFVAAAVEASGAARLVLTPQRRLRSLQTATAARATAALEPSKCSSNFRRRRPLAQTRQLAARRRRSPSRRQAGTAASPVAAPLGTRRREDRLDEAVEWIIRLRRHGLRQPLELLRRQRDAQLHGGLREPAGTHLWWADGRRDVLVRRELRHLQRRWAIAPGKRPGRPRVGPGGGGGQAEGPPATGCAACGDDLGGATGARRVLIGHGRAGGAA